VSNDFYPGMINKTIIKHLTIGVAYVLNHKTNLKIFAEIQQRYFLNGNENNKLFFISFGIKNELRNYYKDF
jgi:hypothetical protein